jgi:hypothetical protein
MPETRAGWTVRDRRGHRRSICRSAGSFPQ